MYWNKVGNGGEIFRQTYTFLKINQTSRPSLVKVVSSGTDVRSVDAPEEASGESERVLPLQRELCGGADTQQKVRAGKFLTL